MAQRQLVTRTQLLVIATGITLALALMLHITLVPRLFVNLGTVFLVIAVIGAVFNGVIRLLFADQSPLSIHRPGTALLAYGVGYFLWFWSHSALWIGLALLISGGLTLLFGATLIVVVLAAALSSCALYMALGLLWVQSFPRFAIGWSSVGENLISPGADVFSLRRRTQAAFAFDMAHERYSAYISTATNPRSKAHVRLIPTLRYPRNLVQAAMSEAVLRVRSIVPHLVTSLFFSGISLFLLWGFLQPLIPQVIQQTLTPAPAVALAETIEAGTPTPDPVGGTQPNATPDANGATAEGGADQQATQDSDGSGSSGGESTESADTAQTSAPNPQGAVETPQPGSPQPGMPQAGSPQPGSPQPGTPQAGTPQPGSPQPGTPQAGSPQPGSPQPGTPQPGTPQAGSPQPGSPQPGTPQAGSPQPGSPQPGTPQAGSPQPGSPQPGSPQPGSPQPGSPQPGTPQPGSPQPGTPQPSSPQPGSPQPGSPQPGSPQPGSPQPGSPQPGTPQSGSPQSGTPQPGSPQPDSPAAGQGQGDSGSTTPSASQTAVTSAAPSATSDQPSQGYGSDGGAPTIDENHPAATPPAANLATIDLNQLVEIDLPPMRNGTPGVQVNATGTVPTRSITRTPQPTGATPSAEEITGTQEQDPFDMQSELPLQFLPNWILEIIRQRSGT